MNIYKLAKFSRIAKVGENNKKWKYKNRLRSITVGNRDST